MGPMMGAGSDVVLIVLVVVLIMLPLTVGAIAIVSALRPDSGQPAALPAAEVLRARYARGELSQSQYREALRVTKLKAKRAVIKKIATVMVAGQWRLWMRGTKA